MEKEKKLNLMKFWIFGTFIIILAATTIYLGVVVGVGNALFGEMRYWLAVIITALLCGIWYFAYSKYLDRKE